MSTPRQAPERSGSSTSTPANSLNSANRELISHGLAELGANLLGIVPDGRFEQLNQANGALTQLSDFHTAFRCLGATTEKLYAVDSSGALYALTRQGGGTLSRMGDTALGRGTLAMSANGPALYAAVDPGKGSVLYSLNTANGAANQDRIDRR